MSDRSPGKGRGHCRREKGPRMRAGERREERIKKMALGLGRIFFALLLDVAVFDLLHEGFALEEVGLETRRELAGHDEELIVDHFRKKDGSAGGNQVCAPL